MKIVHTEAMPALTGETLRLINETNFLNQETKHSCSIIGPNKGPFRNTALDETRYLDFPFSDFDYHPADFFRAYKKLRALEPEVVHTHNSQDAWIFGTAAKLLGLPVVRGRHISKPPPDNQISRLVYTQLADAFTVSSKSVKKMLTEEKLTTPDNVYITPAGLGKEFFDPAKYNENYLKNELNIPLNSTVVGTACLLRPWKGLRTLVKAFTKTQLQDEKDVFLVIAGKGGMKEELEELASPLKERVRFLGFREDIFKVIYGMDLFVLMSYANEATPQVIPQAMAMETPVIVSDFKGFDNVVKTGKTGFRVPTKNEKKLGQKIQEVLSLPNSRLEEITQRAKEFALEKFTLESVANKYLAAYRKAQEIQLD